MDRRACSGVLIVEDDADIAETLTSVLEDEGYKVSAARNGHQALAFLRSDALARPCVILLDVMMPEMNGIEFRREQLREPALATIPVVLVTADFKARVIGDDMCVAATVMKPVDLDKLLLVVARFCGQGSAGH